MLFIEEPPYKQTEKEITTLKMFCYEWVFITWSYGVAVAHETLNLITRVRSSVGPDFLQ